MLNRKLFSRSFLFLCVLSILHYLGGILYLYAEVWWYDILMHFLGGAVVSIFTVLVLTLLNFRSEHTNKIIGLALFSTLCVGVLWEIFELYIGYTSFSDGSQYIFDTAKDLVMDMSGGLFAGLYGLKVLSQKK